MEGRKEKSKRKEEIKGKGNKENGKEGWGKQRKVEGDRMGNETCPLITIIAVMIGHQLYITCSRAHQGAYISLT